MRLFVGLPLSDEAKRGVAKIIKDLKRGHWPVRWEDEDKWHFTAAFLGEVDKFDRVAAAVKRGVGEIKPFEVGFKGLGAFPFLVIPKVIWLGLNGDLKTMARLYKQVRAELSGAGFEFEERSFMPHVTIGRVGKEAKRKQRLELGKLVAKKLQLKIPQRWQVDRVVVYESRLSPKGSKYQVIEEINL
ncbi:MAG: 2'-5' RNA ligase [Candidatus Beckwithbacteria bacterium GW2011_GWB1_47_15]|uniref:RNA 2',3'-cyclic phosphodiesterase n=1 Tax=Candidatus Beckwithbacteria bacterium GW2011_GWB1_47_15 TaxID=1618371 RepID=A0A0G1RV65_9BACT|nr:MAG: 2'-5' RNA ligase, 2'-5' RNA ligase [Candidatus Beckwithbacteria bacterium GW2011_GWC1_49_16]KKU35504.1 MAG: 2'-5' RNA ligase [Candidatus Beckwithbacteria bacterium GW2011_GWA1_46_30]KKU61179.1 MAG: 2'-5' RNA ligase [Candidatus Beckwithbacteria bacterium GW2011_GWB1_47_15]KKU72018.1 MAG: 2'-5' RNA ligase [Candidatus Beckwithbacteria bacterium GW2011_GWA2_47_25]KKW03256.1 MAG: 2'-5' RNA ligase [Candidatus Beckwithbacteria bacterium GW2011_GWC2_49_11]OGD48538.1 MAG: 2'-5' RNA ligase [Cand